MSEIVVGLIGCGKQSIKHIPALKKNGVRIILADIDCSLAKTRANEFGIEYAKTVEELYQDPKITAIDICSPTHSHFSLIISAIENEKYFFCEKPLASSYEEALKIESILNKTDLFGMVGYLYRFHPAFEMVRECIADSIIGKPYFATMRLGGRGSHRAWKHQKNEGGGAINEMMVHMLDLALWYFGPITEIKTILYETVLKEREIQGGLITADAEDLAMVYLKTENGVQIVCESDLITPSYMNYVELQGTNGSIITSILDYFPSIVFCRESRGTYQTGNNVQNFPKVNLFNKQLKYFLDCISGKIAPDRNTIRESVYLLKLIDRIKREVKDIHE
jgi:predicted dehydrogenase